MMTATQDIANALTQDGDTVDLDNGTIFRVRIEPDYDTDVNDFDYLGKVAPVERDRYGDRQSRPDGFDGNAEKIWTQSDQWWWQPPADIERGTETFKAVRQGAIDATAFGYSVWVVELLKGADAYGSPVVADYDCIGGIEPFRVPTDYIADMVAGILDRQAASKVGA